MCYLYFFCLHCLINIHIFDYPDSRLSGLFTLVPPSPDNRGSTVSLSQPLKRWLRVFASSSYWCVLLFTLVVIGQSDCLGFGFMRLN